MIVMDRVAACVLTSGLFLAGTGTTQTVQGQVEFPSVDPKSTYECFRQAYPGTVQGIETTESGGRVLVLSDGTRFVWDDGRTSKDSAELYSRPDLQDTVAMGYPALSQISPPAKGFDPGRLRNEAFLKQLYGHSSQAVQANLESLIWLPGLSGKKLRFNRRQGAADALRRVSAELALLDKRFHKYVQVTAGTFHWRHIKGTDRLSAHSFGIAIDINVKYTDYWRWVVKQDPALKYRNRIPFEIVAAFEKHGFIWGGRWWHFDTMHFEYRPELLQANCLLNQSRKRVPPDPR